MELGVHKPIDTRLGLLLVAAAALGAGFYIVSFATAAIDEMKQLPLDRPVTAATGSGPADAADIP